jgi:L-asparagine transporter-like permease
VTATKDPAKSGAPVPSTETADATERTKERPKERPKERTQQKGRNQLGVWALTGLGIGGIIGAGFFLGSGIVIREAGPAVLLTYVLAGLVLAQVMGAMTSLAINVPVKSSYQEYIERYLGDYLGFVLGWAVVISGILAIGSEAVAMATYSRTWLATVPLGVFAVAYVLLIVFLNTLGLANFGAVETLMSVMKSGVLVGFVAVAALLLLHSLPHFAGVGPATLVARGGWAPHGLAAVWRAMLIVIFSYAGVTTLAMATARARRPARDVPRAALLTTLGVVLLYTGSVLALLLIVPWTILSPHQSPFVTALLRHGLPVPADIFNAVILVASFSVMAGTFYATEWMVISLALARGAPALFRHRGGGRPWPALVATAAGVLATLVLAFLLPKAVYTDLTAASSYFSFVNWLLILLAFAVWYARHRRPDDTISRLAFGAPYATWITAAAIVALGLYSVTEPAFHLGFLVFAVSTALVTGVWFLIPHPRRPRVVPPGGSDTRRHDRS